VCPHGAVLGKVCLFGGEVDPSENGHEGAGAFANDLLLFDPKTYELETVALKRGSRLPRERGWSSMGVMGGSTVVMFGGLSGNDETPERLDDLCVLQL
jgi:hypothetical protein